MKPEPRDELEHYAELVLAGPHGLLSRMDRERIRDHITDATAAIPHLGNPQSVVDVGTGGGLPGIPLALCLPEARVDLVESLGWKCAFLRSATAALGIDDRVQVHEVRAEEAPSAIGREQHDVAVARAVAAPAVIAEYLAPFVRVGGQAAAWTTMAVAHQLPPTDVLTPLGLGSPHVVEMHTPLRDEGTLVLWPKVSLASARFPRRTGVASRRPLG